MAKYDDNSFLSWRIPQRSKSLRTIRATNRSLDLPGSYSWGGLLAPTVRCFQDCARSLRYLRTDVMLSMTSKGIRVEGPLRRYHEHRDKKHLYWLLPLNCQKEEFSHHRLGLILTGVGDIQVFMRVVDLTGHDLDLVVYDDAEEMALEAEYEHRQVFIPQPWPGDYDLDFE